MAEEERSSQEEHLPVQARILDQDLVRRNQALLLQAAVKLFQRKGFHNTISADIAAEAGMSVGSMYRYVTRKDDLLRLLFTYMFGMYEGVLSPIVASDQSPEDKLREAFDKYIRIIDRESDVIIVVYREGYALNQEGRSYTMRRELETNQHFEEIIRQGISAGVFRPVDPELAAYNVVFAAHMWALKRWHFRRKMSLDRYIAEEVDLILGGLRAERQG